MCIEPALIQRELCEPSTLSLMFKWLSTLEVGVSARVVEHLKVERALERLSAWKLMWQDATGVQLANRSADIELNHGT